MNQKNTNQATKVLNPFLGFGWFTGANSKSNTLLTEGQLYKANNQKQF